MSKKLSFLMLMFGVMVYQPLQSIEKQEIPNSEQECTESTRCYCSAKCGFRDKTADDKPIFEPNDSAGKFCYCKQWDFDNYEEDKCELYEE